MSSVPPPLAAPPSRFELYLKLIRFDRPIGTLLLLWPTLWGLWIANAGAPTVTVLLVFVAGTLLMRSAGCAINDVADRDFDAHVARTAERPLAAKRIRTREAVFIACVLALLALVLVIAFLNTLTLQLSFAAAFLAASYPFTKRFFAMPQAYLGIAFGFGIPMAFAASNNEVSALAWWLLAANVLWTIAYDTEYAMVDRDDDLKIGIKTSAILFGRFDVAAIMVCYFGSLIILLGIGKSLGLSWPYWLGLAAASAIALYHYNLIRTRERERCFRAFLHNNWFGAAVFAGLLAHYSLA
ncbi:MAG: 4-hydroxybenzoate octaprenyltransferase [Burkholderiales bacterium]|jgi:4-hydroxybenzoate polyprenyltransferase|nr:4-hydroxybenzoate octaprenyltransferase [Nitrosomonadaceae bacterium]